MAPNTPKGCKPDFHLWTQSGENAPKIRIGAAWKHSRGDGFNIRFDALPVNGQVVAFPPREDDSADADETVVFT